METFDVAQKRDILDRLDDAAAEYPNHDYGTLFDDAIAEIRHLRTIAGVVRDGMTMADIKRELGVKAV